MIRNLKVMKTKTTISYVIGREGLPGYIVWYIGWDYYMILYFKIKNVIVYDKCLGIKYYILLSKVSYIQSYTYYYGQS
jgi:hypothetical protein